LDFIERTGSVGKRLEILKSWARAARDGGTMGECDLGR
jgi:hypothetical protein